MCSESNTVVCQRVCSLNVLFSVVNGCTIVVNSGVVKNHLRTGCVQSDLPTVTTDSLKSEIQLKSGTVLKLLRSTLRAAHLLVV